MKLPQGVTHDMGMLVEPFAVGANAAERAGAEQGKNIVIVGAGTIGNCTAQIAVARGANVLITDIKDGRLQYAQDCGIKNCCNTNRVSLAQAIDGAFGSAGADVLIDCCGIPEMLQNMVCCAPKCFSHCFGRHIWAGYSDEYDTPATRRNRYYQRHAICPTALPTSI